MMKRCNFYSFGDDAEIHTSSFISETSLAPTSSSDDDSKTVQRSQKREFQHLFGRAPSYITKYASIRTPLQYQTRRGRRALDNTRHMCKLCGRFYSRKDNLRVHQRVHSGEMPYECEQCGKRFRWQSTWQSHRDASKCVSENIPPCQMSALGSSNATSTSQHLSTPEHDSAAENDLKVVIGSKCATEDVQQVRVPSSSLTQSLTENNQDKIVQTAEFVHENKKLCDVIMAFEQSCAVNSASCTTSSVETPEEMSISREFLIANTLSKLEISLTALTNLLSIPTEINENDQSQ